MEQILTKKHILKKIIFLLVFVILFNFVSPQIVWAGSVTSTVKPQTTNPTDSSSAASTGYEAAEWVGGVLWTPIQALFLGLGDTIVTIMQKMVYGLESSFIVISTSSGIGSTIFSWIIGIGVTVGVVALNFIPVVGPAMSVGIVSAVAAGTVVGIGVKHLTKPETFYLPLFGISPQEIFSDEVPLLDVNFFEPKTYKRTWYTYDENGKQIEHSEVLKDEEGNEIKSSASVLQENIAKWYVALRNFALVGLLSVLVYIGIRIIFGSNAADKAKYKERLMDWIVAMFLLFMMHYIMYFSIILTQSITNALKENLQDVAVNVGDLSKYKLEGNAKEVIEKNTLKSKTELGEPGDTIWLTNFMGQSRIQLQMINENSSGDTKLMQFGYTIIYFVFIIYTITFLFQYLKRVVYMAFLTMIAPVVALTYPIDKMNDGRAQAFDMWLKEYIFNLLLQPFHLLLYTVLIGSAMDFATNNTIYAIVAIGFLIPAEKLLRKFFGFEKASTASVADAAVGGAMVMKGLDMVKKIGRTSEPKKIENNRGKIRTQKNSTARGVGGMIEDNFDRNQSSTRQVSQNQEENSEQRRRLNPQGGADQNITESTSSGSQGGGTSASYSTDNGADAIDGFGTTASSVVGANAIYNARESYADDTKEAQEGEGTSSSTGQTSVETGGSGENAESNSTPEPEVRRGTIEDDGEVPSIRRGFRNVKATYKPTKTDFKRGALRFAGASGRQLASLTGRAAGIVAGATAATIATTASGGKNALGTYGAGIMAGNAIGGNLSNTAVNFTRTAANAAGNVASTFEEGRMGKEAYQDKLQDKADQYTMDSAEVRKKYIQEFGADKYKPKLEASRSYRKEGITNDDIIMEALNLDSKNFGDEDSQKRILVAKLASTYKSEKDIQSLEKRLIEAKGLSPNDAKILADGVRKINKLV